MIGSLVTNPRGFLSTQIKYRGAQTQTYIAVVVGLAFALQHVGAYLQLDDLRVELYEVIFLHASIAVVVPIGIWLVGTVAIVMATRILAGRIRYGDVFRLTGWGLLPLVASGLVQTAGRVYALRGAEHPELGMYSHLEYEWSQYRSFLETANGDPVFVGATILAVPFVLYTGYLWMMVVEEIGVEDGIDITRPKAAAAVALPTILCLLWLFRPFL